MKAPKPAVISRALASKTDINPSVQKEFKSSNTVQQQKTVYESAADSDSAFVNLTDLKTSLPCIDASCQTVTLTTSPSSDDDDKHLADDGDKYFCGPGQALTLKTTWSEKHPEFIHGVIIRYKIKHDDIGFCITILYWLLRPERPVNVFSNLDHDNAAFRLEMNNVLALRARKEKKGGPVSPSILPQDYPRSWTHLQSVDARNSKITISHAIAHPQSVEIVAREKDRNVITASTEIICPMAKDSKALVEWAIKTKGYNEQTKSEFIHSLHRPAELWAQQQQYRCPEPCETYVPKPYKKPSMKIHVPTLEPDLVRPEQHLESNQDHRDRVPLLHDQDSEQRKRGALKKKTVKESLKNSFKGSLYQYFPFQQQKPKIALNPAPASSTFKSPQIAKQSPVKTKTVPNPIGPPKIAPKPQLRAITNKTETLSKTGTWKSASKTSLAEIVNKPGGFKEFVPAKKLEQPSAASFPPPFNITKLPPGPPPMPMMIPQEKAITLPDMSLPPMPMPPNLNIPPGMIPPDMSMPPSMPLLPDPPSFSNMSPMIPMVPGLPLPPEMPMPPDMPLMPGLPLPMPPEMSQMPGMAVPVSPDMSRPPIPPGPPLAMPPQGSGAIFHPPPEMMSVDPLTLMPSHPLDLPLTTPSLSSENWATVTSTQMVDPLTPVMIGQDFHQHTNSSFTGLPLQNPSPELSRIHVSNEALMSPEEYHQIMVNAGGYLPMSTMEIPCFTSSEPNLHALGYPVGQQSNPYGKTKFPKSKFPKMSPKTKRFKHLKDVQPPVVPSDKSQPKHGHF